jgi:acetyl/propionyl-CoA carboxylase alpha subunit
MKIPLNYDPMIAKLIVHADTRDLAIEKMLKAIDEYENKAIDGLENKRSIFERFKPKKIK